MDINGAPQTPGTTESAPTAPTGGGAPSPSTSNASAAPVQTPSAPTGASAVPSTPIERTPSRKLLTADDDSIPDDAETYEISRSAFKKRLERYSRSQLKQMFGTDNPEDIMRWKQENEEFQRQAEERKLAEMSDAERFKVQYERAANEAAHWRQQYETLQESYTIREQDQKMTAIGRKYIDPDYMDFVMNQFAMHLQSVDDEAIGNPEEYADRWIKGFVDARPRFGVGFGATPAAPPVAAAPPAPPAPPVRQVPISNGATPARPQAAPAVATQKTLAPGQPNSMSEAEAKRWMRENGYTF